MRIKLAFAAITVAVLAVVGCQPDSSPAPDPCKVASDESATFERWVREASMDGARGEGLTAFCQSLLNNYSRKV